MNKQMIYSFRIREDRKKKKFYDFIKKLLLICENTVITE